MNIDRDNIIIGLFHEGLAYKEILAFLLKWNNLDLSLRQLKRILKRYNLRRRLNNDENIADVTEVIQSELLSDGCNLGYRSMHQKLIIKYHLNTSREQVRQILGRLDPEGVNSRKKRRLRRRTYVCKGPNELWHMDGYDKLKPYGFAIHGCIDGFSRKILWLNVNSTNNDPAIIAKYYLNFVSQTNARRIRADCGTENSNVAGIQRLFRTHPIDESDNAFGLQSFLYGKSTSNQRIEAYWSKLRPTVTQYWMSHFKDMRDAGELDETDDLFRDCLRFSYMSLIQRSLDGAKELHNTHRIRRYNFQECPSGRPNVIYDIPEVYDAEDYIVPVTDEDIEIANEVTTEPLLNGCSVEFNALAHFIMQELNAEEPENAAEAKQLYLDMCSIIRNF
ncbi:uncharacterized protein [Clytia hemisphaerica]|uniref:uncharacterized protein isoform X2 n=1 Tax=Clytia hemisphaerica TaxID=252671 RepID=UPI0034D66317